MRKRLRVLLVTTLTLLMLITCMAYTITATASTDFEMVNGASIRVHKTDENLYGIKFAAKVTDTSKQYKMLIIPQDYYEGYLGEDDRGDKNVVEYLIGKFGEDKLAIVQNCAIKGNIVEGSIVKINYNNLNRKFLGIAYYQTEEGNQIKYNVAQFENGIPSSYSIVEKAQETYESGEYADFQMVLAGLEGIITDGIKQANGIIESEKDSVVPSISLTETTKKVFVGDSFKLAYTPAIATNLVKYTGENVDIALDGTVTATTPGITTITASVFGAQDTLTLTTVEKDITGLIEKDKVISWNEVANADGYIISINGVETSLDTNSYTISESGVYNISVCAVVGQARGNFSSLNDLVIENDAVDFSVVVENAYTYTSNKTAEGISVTLTTVEDAISWARNPELPSKSTNIRTSSDAFDDEFISVEFTAVGSNLADNDINIALRTSSTTTTSLWRKHFSFVANEDGTVAVHYDSTGVETNYTMYNGYANDYLKTGMIKGEKYCIVAGIDNNNDFYYIIYKVESNGKVLIAKAQWKYADISANIDASLPESGYIIVCCYAPFVTRIYTINVLSAKSANALIKAIPSA